MDEYHNPIIESRPVYVTEHVWAGGILAYTAGTFVTIREALQFNIPLKDQWGHDIPTPQAPQPVVETQDIKPPRKR